MTFFPACPGLTWLCWRAFGRRSGHWWQELSSTGAADKCNAYGWIWSNYSDLTRPHPKWWWKVREIPLFQGNLGWWNIIIWPDGWLVLGWMGYSLGVKGEVGSGKEAPFFLGSFSEMLSLKGLTTLPLQKLFGGRLKGLTKNHLGVLFSSWGWYHKSQVNMVVIIANGDVFLVFETLKIMLSLNVPFYRIHLQAATVNRSNYS